MSPTRQWFSANYGEAREKFLAAAGGRGTVDSYPHPTHRGALGEELAIDAVLLGPGDASSLLIVTAGTHGVEGFCGSACQVMFLRDDALLRRLDDRRVAVLLVHAVNPHGFSHRTRTNEDNIDLNRNFIDFDQPPPANPGYAGLHDLLVPEHWPPGEADTRRLQSAMEQGGRALVLAIGSGQYTHPHGMFHGGTGPTWSNRTIRAVLRRYAAGRRRVAWVDLHTGLGPYGHGEKIFGSHPPEVLARARGWWGMDLVPSTDPGSVSPRTSGYITPSARQECPDAEITAMTLEYGTHPHAVVRDALRGEAWLSAHPDAPTALRERIKMAVRDAFHVEQDDWKGMVTGQFRCVALQTINGLGAA